jgi:hypothetical protein
MSKICLIPDACLAKTKVKLCRSCAQKGNKHASRHGGLIISKVPEWVKKAGLVEDFRQVYAKSRSEFQASKHCRALKQYVSDKSAGLNKATSVRR